MERCNWLMKLGIVANDCIGIHAKHFLDTLGGFKYHGRVFIL